MDIVKLRRAARGPGPARGAAATLAASVLCYWLALQRGAPLAPPPAPQRPPADAATLQESFGRVADTVKPSVVSVRTVQYTAAQQRRLAAAAPRPWVEGIGSGVIVDPRGYILTNEHVVHGADRIEVTFADSGGQVFLATVVRSDASLDLAVLKVAARRALPCATFGDSARVRVGDWAIAVGSPFGLPQSVTVGVISAVRQSFRVDEHIYSDFFQTDAAINRGNSGGPLVNLRGEVIGINTAIYGPTGVFSGIGFAIPSNQARGIVAPLTAERLLSRPKD